MPVKITRDALVGEYLQRAADALYHQGVPWYPETDIVSVPFTPGVICAGGSIVASVKSQWVLDVRFVADVEQIKALLQRLQILHTLRNTPGILSIVGATTSASGALKGFLLELPAHRKLIQAFIVAARSGRPIGRERRQMWCRQLVSAVAEVHAKGFLVGILGEDLADGIGLDFNDNVSLFQFRAVHLMPERYPAAIPPECRTTAAKLGFYPARPQTDLYQLGIYLWNIMTWSITKPDGVALSAEIDLKAAEQIGDVLPEYLVNIITVCQREDPRQRLPAWKLLELFPTITRDRPIFNKSSGVPVSITTLESLGRTNPMVTVCHVCRQRPENHHFNCNVCHRGGFDICPSCVNKGEHCEDDSHYLREILPRSAESKFYSSVSGEVRQQPRRIIVL